jgi:hypothetical protein
VSVISQSLYYSPPAAAGCLQAGRGHSLAPCHAHRDQQVVTPAEDAVPGVPWQPPEVVGLCRSLVDLALRPVQVHREAEAKGEWDTVKLS